SFHAIVWSYFDIEKAKTELSTMVKKQFDNGMIPHMNYWIKSPTIIGKIADWLFKNYPENDRSFITQPAIIAYAVECVYNKSKDIEWLKSIINSLIKYYDWFYNERNVDDDGLVVVIHPWETGLDMLPCWDIFIKKKRFFKIQAGLWLNGLIKKYNKVNWDIKKIIEMDLFVVKDVSFNVIYILGLESMSRLCETLGDEERKEIFKSRSKETLNSIEKKCWNSKHSFYFDLYSRDDKKIEEFTVSGLFPIVVDIEKSHAKRIIEDHILNKEEFWPNYPIPSVSISSEKFNPNDSLLLWRGPTWLNTNWFLAQGLKKFGYKNEALSLYEKTIELVEKSGFWEYYHPFTGNGEGAKELSWSTLVVDLIKKFSKDKK
ncbi:MAG: MGH1-like glycoside hydrolase domain-containing protein, partial [Candidatus Helarchaeota archaeon]